MASQWGRKETIIWPPHSPIYTYGAILMALLCTSLFVWARFTFGASPLQQYYTPAYVRSAFGATFDKHDKYRLLFVGTGTKAGRLALDADVIDGRTPSPMGKVIPAHTLPGRLVQRPSRSLSRAGGQLPRWTVPCVSQAVIL
jgi:hypothetical protein